MSWEKCQTHFGYYKNVVKQATCRFVLYFLDCHKCISLLQRQIFKVEDLPVSLTSAVLSWVWPPWLVPTQGEVTVLSYYSILLWFLLVLLISYNSNFCYFQVQWMVMDREEELYKILFLFSVLEKNNFQK